jgi:SPOR domain
VNPKVTILAAALVGAACSRGPDLANKPPSATRGLSTVSVLRIPREGGTARLYRVPALDSAQWTPADKLPPVERPLGAAAEQGLVFVLDRKNNVAALDLDTRRVRNYFENVRYAAIGPDGALYVVDTAGSVVQLVRRTPVRFRAKLPGKPTDLYGTMDGALVARVSGKEPALEFLGSDQPPTTTRIPEGPVAFTFLGDLVAVAADSAVVLYAPGRKSEPKPVPVSGGAKAVLFSPSGHRLYIGRATAPLIVTDRFDGGELLEIELPGAVKELRGDLNGNWVLARPEQGDSVWVIDVGSGKFLGTVPARWAADLPAVAPLHTLLVRRGADVAALDLSASGFTELGRVEGGATDFWLPIAWAPAHETEIPFDSESTAVAAADNGPPGPNVYLQVSSSQNPAWANELSDKLSAAGLPASVLPPRRSEEAFRVVLGPYATKEQAMETSKKLGMPSFIVTAQEQSAR